MGKQFLNVLNGQSIVVATEYSYPLFSINITKFQMITGLWGNTASEKSLITLETIQLCLNHHGYVSKASSLMLLLISYL